ncbi:G-type lectin S-receptor-like serine/threonine-protein kinase LECRK2 [Lotus japonicus]|uniref:G-type lectin S-receptor-like serine/threonine-protein kinase LECRK2 n=1 Tax=Lotus japonicus TaxID=34305 RepID=UPI00258BA8AE|nr:G-type lectin S-receptor-like serine/threonine-protein kinase LECRK2 [Lotus japonicus]
MASTPVLFLLLLTLFTTEATAERRTSTNSTIHLINRTIPLWSSLSPEGKQNSWASSSGRFAFGFYPKGNGFAVGIWLFSSPNITVVWTAFRDTPPFSSNSSLSLTDSGLVLRTGEQQQLQIASPDPNNPYYRGNQFQLTVAVASASMLDSGNFVLYDKNLHVIWESFAYLTDTMLGGQNFSSGLLVSSLSKSDRSRGRFYLRVQSDLSIVAIVAYPFNSPGQLIDSYWAYREAKQLILNVEGVLCSHDNLVGSCLYDKPTNKSRNTTSIYRATLDVDGNLRLYEHRFEGNSTSSHEESTLWQALNDTCEVKGVCGANSYCSSMNGNAVCHCYPGFVPSNSSDNMPLDCKQTYIKDDCESSKNPMVLYRVIQWENISWGDTEYSIIPMKKKACEKSCQEDCACGGAMYYSNGNCKKYNLPLIYGKRFQDTSRVALLKVPSGNVTRPTPTSTSNITYVPNGVVDNKRSLILTLALTLGCISLFSLVFTVSIFYTYRRRVYRHTILSANEDLGFTEECSLRSFSYNELVKSTGGFAEEIGRGSFGAVYKGMMGGSSNRRIAVKRLERVADEGEREFRAEITAIARTHHRNLVKLVGFCIEGSKKLLVYEYVSNGSLANLLFNDKMQGMSWKERMKIALDVARGVLYLHEECEVRIIHCNISPQNILMDEAWTAKISDFGLARLLKLDYSTTKKRDEGTSRYLAPEWHKDASVSIKVDIYSFGMVLLEIICRRSGIEMNASSAEEILLSRWVYQCFAAGKLNLLLTHDEDVDWKIMERMVKVGLWCVQDNPSLRPSVKNVILMLEGLKDIPIPPSPIRLVE